MKSGSSNSNATHAGNESKGSSPVATSGNESGSKPMDKGDTLSSAQGNTTGEALKSVKNTAKTSPVIKPKIPPVAKPAIEPLFPEVYSKYSPKKMHLAAAMFFDSTYAQRTLSVSIYELLYSFLPAFLLYEAFKIENLAIEIVREGNYDESIMEYLTFDEDPYNYDLYHDLSTSTVGRTLEVVTRHAVTAMKNSLGRLSFNIALPDREFYTRQSTDLRLSDPGIIALTRDTLSGSEEYNLTLKITGEVLLFCRTVHVGPALSTINGAIKFKAIELLFVETIWYARLIFEGQGDVWFQGTRPLRLSVEVKDSDGNAYTEEQYLHTVTIKDNTSTDRNYDFPLEMSPYLDENTTLVAGDVDQHSWYGTYRHFGALTF